VTYRPIPPAATAGEARETLLQGVRAMFPLDFLKGTPPPAAVAALALVDKIRRFEEREPALRAARAKSHLDEPNRDPTMRYKFRVETLEEAIDVFLKAED
jgi:hypothetical protein